MGRLKEYLSEDSNQYGPGTDLMVSLMALLLVMTFINGALYKLEQGDGRDRFKLANKSFDAGDFLPKPFRKFVDEPAAMAKIKAIALEYQTVKENYPYIFVIGHSSEIDIPNPDDPSDPAKWVRNWDFAGERAVLISKFLQKELDKQDHDKLVVVSTGEFDKKDPTPGSQANARVEVVFGNDWKPPSRSLAQASPSP